jgi:hypothetical protein
MPFPLTPADGDIFDQAGQQYTFDASTPPAGAWWLTGAAPVNRSMDGNLITDVADPVNQQDAVNLQYADATYVNVTGDTMTGPLNMTNHLINNVTHPIANQDAATKLYVDEAVANATLFQDMYQVWNNTPDLTVTANWLDGYFWIVRTQDPANPDTTIVVLPGIPLGTSLNNNDRIIWVANTSQYAIIYNANLTETQADTLYLRLDGANPMQASIDMGTHGIINLTDPVNPQDAVTKNFAETTYLNVAGDTMTGQLNMSSGVNINCQGARGAGQGTGVYGWHDTSGGNWMGYLQMISNGYYAYAPYAQMKFMKACGGYNLQPWCWSDYGNTAAPNYYFIGTTYQKQNYTGPSEARFKTDIVDVDAATARAKLAGFKLKRFRLAPPKEAPFAEPEDEQYGFIIEDIETTAPEIISEYVGVPADPEMGTTGVEASRAYSQTQLVALLVAEVQSLRREVETLHART